MKRKMPAFKRAEEYWVILLLVTALLFFCLRGFAEYGAKFRGALLTRPIYFSQTQGTVIHSNVVFQPGGKTAPSYRYNIAYLYHVGTNSYTSNLVNFDWVEASSDRNFAIGISNRYKVGQSVPVFYLKNSPAFAVLDPSEKGTTIYLFLALLTVIGCCLKSWLHYFGLLRRRHF